MRHPLTDISNYNISISHVRMNHGTLQITYRKVGYDYWIFYLKSLEFASISKNMLFLQRDAFI